MASCAAPPPDRTPPRAGRASSPLQTQPAPPLPKDVARKIESELQYPGQIKVTVIREMRAVDYAK